MCSFNPLITILIHRRASRESLIQVQEARQLFIGTYNEAISVAAMCVNNPDCSSLRIDD
jgi:hypothetical protein